MEEGFQLNRLQMKGTGIPIHERVQFSTAVLPHPAKTPFAFGYAALFGTEFALDRFLFKRREPGGSPSLYETFFNDLCMGRPRTAEHTGKREGAGARSKKPEKLPSRQFIAWFLSSAIQPVHSIRLSRYGFCSQHFYIFDK